MLLSDLWLQSLFCRPGIPCLKSSVCKKSGRPRTVSHYSKLHEEVRLHRTVIALTPLHKTRQEFHTKMQRSSTPESPFSAFLSWSWSFPLQATSALRLSITLFLFFKFLLLIKSLKTLLQYHNFLELSYSLVNWLILGVILTLSSHWASSDAKGFFQLFLHFIFVLTCTEYKTQFCNFGFKMQISSLLGNLIVSITCSELSKAQRVQKSVRKFFHPIYIQHTVLSRLCSVSKF